MLMTGIEVRKAVYADGWAGTIVEMYPDPNVAGTWAVLMDNGDQLLVMSQFDGPVEIEEVEFSTWPPSPKG